MRGAHLGDRVIIHAHRGDVTAIVIATLGAQSILVPLDDSKRVAHGDVVECLECGDRTVLGTALCGRAVDGLGRPLDGDGAPDGVRLSLTRYLTAPPPSSRRALARPMWTGVRSIDALLTLAAGMRVGIFGPPGAGKSSLLHAISRGVRADAVVVALIGERGAEAERHVAMLDARTTVVCAAADRSAGERIAAGELAMAQAGRLRECGLDVVLIFDSLARYAHAVREIALAAGEAPGRGGYPASVFARLAQLCECAGATAEGSVTLIATILSDAVESGDPLAEAARSHIDGHLVLSRRRAERGAFPAIEVPSSLSRPMPQVVDPAHLRAAQTVRTALARLEESREARELGVVPAEPAEPALEAFLRQGSQQELIAGTLSALYHLADRI